MKYLIIPILLVMVMGFASAEDMQTIKLGELQKLFIQCTNNGLACSGSESATITIYYPNKSLYILGQAMTKEDGILYRNVTLNQLGVYTASGYIIDGSYMAPFSFLFEVTPNGESLKEGNIVLFFYILFIVLFILYIYFLIMNIVNLATAEYTIFKVVYSWIIYFGLIFFTYISNNYLVMPFIKDNMVWVLSVSGVTHFLIPLIGLLVTIIKKGFDKKRPVSIGEITGRAYG